jgi:apolipoprotein N-acyltransferase
VRFSLPARASVALAAGVLLAGAFEPFAQAWLILPSLALLTLGTRNLSVGRSVVVGLAFGVGFQFTLLLWIREIGPDAWITLCLIESLFFAALAALWAVLSRLPGWPLWLASAWVAVEQLRSSFPVGGLPWGRLAFASVDTPMAAWLPYLGTTGTSFVWALLGVMTAWVTLNLRKQPGRTVLVGLVVAMVALLPSLAPYAAEERGVVTVAVVQGNVPGDGTDVLFDHRQVTANHVSATVDLAAEVAADRVEAPDFVVWPENSTAVDPFLDEEINAGIWAASTAIGVPILVGGIVQGVEPDQVLNQGIVWDPETGGGDRYTKRHPVPYGEYIPFREQLPFTANFGRLREISRDMLGGDRSQPLSIGGVMIADSICFDVAYDDGIYEQVRQGSDLLVVQTSNAMFVHTAQIEQQFAITRLRAIETGKAAVVAATNGVSGVVDADGAVVARAEVRAKESVVAAVATSRDIPWGVKIGPLLVWLSWLVLGLGLAMAVVRPRVGRARVSSQL